MLFFPWSRNENNQFNFLEKAVCVSHVTRALSEVRFSTFERKDPNTAEPSGVQAVQPRSGAGAQGNCKPGHLHNLFAFSLAILSQDQNPECSKGETKL